MSSKFSEVTETTQVRPDPLISDKVKLLDSLRLSDCLPVSVGRSALGAHAAGGGGGVLVAAVLRGGAVVVVAAARAAVEVVVAAVARAAVGVPEVDGVAVRVGETVAVGAGASAGTSGGGEAWTADPLLVQLAIRATITASTATATPRTATRRTQYR